MIRLWDDDPNYSIKLTSIIVGTVTFICIGYVLLFVVLFSLSDVTVSNMLLFQASGVILAFGSNRVTTKIVLSFRVLWKLFRLSNINTWSGFYIWLEKLLKDDVKPTVLSVTVNSSDGNVVLEILSKYGYGFTSGEVSDMTTEELSQTEFFKLSDRNKPQFTTCFLCKADESKYTAGFYGINPYTRHHTAVCESCANSIISSASDKVKTQIDPSEFLAHNM